MFGNQASVLVGDFLYSRSFQMMVELGEMRILDVLANATNTIAEGEVLQLMNCNNPDTGEADYMEVIYRKTAKLFEAGTRIGAILAKQRRRHRASARDLRPASRVKRSSSSTTRSTTTRSRRSSARTSATTSPKASRRCR